MYIRAVLGISLLNLIIFIMTVTNAVISEWIDIPQFSDESKVYRSPFTKSNRHQIFIDKLSNINKYKMSNTTDNIINRPTEIIQVPLMVNIEITTLPHNLINANDDIKEDTKEIKQSSKIHNNNTVFNNSNDLNKSIMAISNISSNDCTRHEIEQFHNNTMTTIGKYKLTILKSEKLNDKVTSSLSFLQYLPMDLIKRVHNTLLGSMQTNLKNKENFLLSIKKSMLHKLESILAPVLNSIRRKRGSHWNESDDHVGFPSLEGALLAISFLTFAVYLVQLVMMLLRNFSNSGINPANTVLVNRNKRSVQQLSDDSIRILKYLDEFSYK